MCFAVTLVLGAFAVALWLQGAQAYAAVSGSIALLFLLLTLRKIVKNAPCLFGRRRDC